MVIHQLEDIREKDPILYEVLEKQSIHSLVVVPLYDNGKVIAFFCLVNIAENISFDYTQSMLQMTGYFFVSSMKQRNLVRKLQEISFHDQLTKLGNRFALEDYATQVDSRRSIGVVFCDITGLKRVNDSQGHIAGDKFINDKKNAQRKDKRLAVLYGRGKCDNGYRLCLEAGCVSQP